MQELPSLTGLRRLSVRHNDIGDLGTVASLANLIELDVGDNRIRELTPLDGLPRLTVAGQDDLQSPDGRGRQANQQ